MHLILDNRPYKPIYDPKAPRPLERAHRRRSDRGGPDTCSSHSRAAAATESVKTKDAIAITQFWVGKKGEATTDIKKAMLIYSRPKGDYKGAMAGHASSSTSSS